MQDSSLLSFGQYFDLREILSDLSRFGVVKLKYKERDIGYVNKTVKYEIGGFKND